MPSRLPVVLAFSIVALQPFPLVAQDPLTATLSLGMATAYGGNGPSGSVRIEVPVADLSGSVTLILGGTGWIARTTVAGDRFGIKRDIKGLGPQLSLEWHPAGAGWRLALGGGVEHVWNRNDGRLIVPCWPPDDCGPPVPVHSRHHAGDTGFGTVLAGRLTLPAVAGATIELGAVGTRHALFDDPAWWTRFEVGFRVGLGGGGQ